MLQKKYWRNSDFLLILGLFFLSNVSAFIQTFWHNPQFVFAQLALWLALTACAVWAMSKRNLIPKFFENLKMSQFIFPFLIFSGLSIFWSVYWEISLCRWLIFFCAVITGGYIGLLYDIKRIIKLLSFFGVYILLLSSIPIFFMPHIGVMHYHSIQGAWKGLYWHKNHMGLIATFVNMLSIINIVDAWRSTRQRVFSWGLLYFFSLLFIVKSDSAAALIVSILLHGMIFLALIWLKFREKIRKSHYFIFIAVLIFASFILYLNADYFLGIFNRNTALTGRVPMWGYLFETYLSKRPFLGYGFNAFWYIDSYRVAIGKAAGYPDPIVIADNGFIDILINTGYIGLILFLIFYFGAWWRSIKYASKAKDINGLFPVILMTYTALANVSWSVMFENESFFMLVMLAVLFRVSANAPINYEGDEIAIRV